MEQEIENLVIMQQDGQGNGATPVRQVLAMDLEVAQDTVQLAWIREQELGQRLDWLQI